MFTLFRPACKTDAQYGQLPQFQTPECRSDPVQASFIANSCTHLVLLGPLQQRYRRDGVCLELVLRAPFFHGAILPSLQPIRAFVRDASATIVVFRMSLRVANFRVQYHISVRTRRSLTGCVVVAVCFTLLMCTTLRNFEKGRTLMHTFVAAVGLAALMIGSVFLTSADAARRVAPAYDQPRTQRNSGGSWRCYPYCDGGTYEGRPVREWLKPDRW